jgi:hypothetical protein
MKRRTLIRWAVAWAAVSPFHRVRPGAQGALPDASVTTLGALAGAVLPKSLGRRAVDQIATQFAGWVRGYQAGVLTDHGYGHTRLERTPPSPADRYAKQLDALEQAAQRQGRSFGQLDPEPQRALVDAALKDAKVDRLPPRPNGQHVISDLMAFYFQSSEANDSCFRASIGRQRCRPLSAVAKRPQPLS